MNCLHCGHEKFTTVRRRESDGHCVVFRRCNRCGRNWESKFIPKLKVNFDSLPWVEPMPPKYCARCQQTYAQAHHYFPRALARQHGVNPEAWPIEDLCNNCHGLWHSVVTPGLLKRDW